MGQQLLQEASFDSLNLNHLVEASRTMRDLSFMGINTKGANLTALNNCFRQYQAGNMDDQCKKDFENFDNRAKR